MSTRNSIRRLFTVVGVLALLLLFVPLVTGTAMAASQLEILQAVKDGVPNVGDNRVAMGEVFARDG